MKTSIKFKLLPLTLIGIIVMGVVFGYLFVKNQQETLNTVYLSEINSAKKSFYNLEENDVKMLKAAMTDFMMNEKAKELFIIGQEEYRVTNNCSSANKELFDYTKDLYAKHKALGITHFYFETADNKIFLRVHGQANCGDNLGRATYLKSKETNSWGTGIELGATAFALRVVSPYYDGNNLLGYIEYGEEIDHFNNIMKEETDNDYLTIVQKTSIKPEAWATVVKNKNLPRNNYEDYQNYLVIESTDHGLVYETACWNEENIASVTDEGNLFAKFDKEGKTFICGGFSLFDAKNQKVGAIVVVRDITDQESGAKALIRNTIIITAALVIIIGLLVMFVTDKIIVSPIKSLTATGNKISEGELETALPVIKSNDEIKDLSETMNMLVGGIRFLKQEKEQKAAPVKKEETAEASKPANKKKK